MRGHEEERHPPRLERWSRIEFHPVNVQRDDGGAPLLGCAKAAAWLVVDEDSLQAFEALRRRASVDRAEAWLRERTGEEWDAEDLARLLLARGFVRAIDGVPLDPSDTPGRQHRIVFRAPAEAARRLHHPVALAAVAVLAAAWFPLVALRPEVLPRPAHLLLTAHPALNLLAAFVVGFALLALHEGAHYLMARSYGIDARIRLSHRLYVPVLETDCTNAWLLTPRQRIHVFLAGIASGLALGACFAAGAVAARAGLWWPSLERPLLFLHFLAIVPLAYQLLFFAKTDLYYVLLAATGERRLVDDATTWMRLRLHRLLTGARVPCEACGRGVAPEEPYCARCLTARDTGEPARFPLRPEQHRRLAWFSGLLVPASLLVVPYVLATALLAAHQQATLARALLEEGLAASRWLLVAEGVAALVVTAAGSGLALWFAARDAARATARAWRALVRRVQPT